MPTMLNLATALTPGLEILGLWASLIAVYGGGTAAVALVTRRQPAELANEAVRGSAVGFVIGIPAIIAATIVAAAVG